MLRVEGRKKKLGKPVHARSLVPVVIHHNIFVLTAVKITY
jgi:hypothetical protein